MTVTTAVAIQPVEIVYVMVVVPPATPVIAPEFVIVATDVVLLLQDMPPEVASFSKPTAPTQTVVVPVIGNGSALMVIVYVLKQPVLVSA